MAYRIEAVKIRHSATKLRGLPVLGCLARKFGFLPDPVHIEGPNDTALDPSLVCEAASCCFSAATTSSVAI